MAPDVRVENAWIILSTRVNVRSENAKMEHARPKGDTSQATDFCWSLAQVRYDGTRLRKQ